MHTIEQLVVPRQSPGLKFAQLSALSNALTLAASLRRALATPARFVVEQQCCQIIVEGRLNLSHEEITTRAGALCTFVVPLAWKTRQPRVWCREPWRKRALAGKICNAEWHILGDGSLCYELADRWGDEIIAAEQAAGWLAAAELAADWCLNSVRWLLYRHPEAFRRGLELWDPSWPAWAHFAEGRREYKQLKEWENRARAKRPLAPTDHPPLTPVAC